MSNVAENAASVVALWRYPVKSMMGEELNAAGVTEQGVLGDRPYATSASYTCSRRRHSIASASCIHKGVMR